MFFFSFFFILVNAIKELLITSFVCRDTLFLILYELYIFTREIFKIFLYTCPLSIHILFYASKGIMYNFSKITVLRYCCYTSSYLIFKMN